MLCSTVNYCMKAVVFVFVCFFFDCSHCCSMFALTKDLVGKVFVVWHWWLPEKTFLVEWE